MKTVKIRCRLGDTRPIRAIAFDGAPDPAHPDEKPRDSCPTLRFFQEASRLYPDSWLDLSAVLDETAKSGPPKNDSKFKHVKDGIYEFKSWKLRVFCFFDDNSIILCTHGVFKHTQQASQEEIEEAKSKRSAYLEAKKRKQISHAP